MTESCYFCGEIERIETHHIVPRRFDGSDDGQNLVDVCPTCHSKLESLYDKRFYDELGVSNEHESEIEEECAVDDCTADALRYVDDEAAFPYPVCDAHYICSRISCDNQPVSTTCGEPGIVKYCEECGECRHPDCGSRDVAYYEHDVLGDILLCEPHIDEGWLE